MTTELCETPAVECMFVHRGKLNCRLRPRGGQKYTLGGVSKPHRHTHRQVIVGTQGTSTPHTHA